MVVLRLVCTTTACQFVHRSKHGRTDARRARRVSSACLCCDQATRRTSALKISPTESRLLRSGSARLRGCIRTVPTEPLPSFYCEKPNESCRTRIAHASHTHRTRIAHASHTLALTRAVAWEQCKFQDTTTNGVDYAWPDAPSSYSQMTPSHAAGKCTRQRTAPAASEWHKCERY